jgi:hypothetical protein
MARIRSRPALALALLFCALSLAQAEQLKSQLGFYVDMPAGFTLKGGDGKARFAFADPEGGMEFDILGYESGRFSDAKAIANASLTKLGSSGDATPYAYEGRSAIFAELGFSLDGKKQRGYAVFIAGRRKTEDKGAPGSPTAGIENSYALIAYTSEAEFAAYSDFILSCLDAFSIDRAAQRSPGPVSQFTLDWPPARDAERTVALPSNGSASLPWSDEEAAQEADTDAREYKVLTAYANEAELSKDAWARFYRMVYRESAARLDRLSLEASRLLGGSDPTETARRVLAWVQGFVYDRDQKGIDFIPPLAAAYGAKGDCDSRAVVAAIVLERLGIDSILMVSREYSHAMLGVDVPGGGQRFDFNGKKYLVGETTTKVGLGMIAASMADWSKWMGINLGD